MENNINSKAKHPPVWIFGLLYLPYGISGAFASATLGAILQKYGVDKNKIASAVAASLLIATFQFLWTPTVDIGFRRRTWFMIMCVLGGLTMASTALIDVPNNIDLFIYMVLGSQVFVNLTGPCIGGLMATTLPDDVRGKAAGFSNAGNIGAGAVGAGISLTLFQNYSLPAVSIATGLMLMLPGLIALAIPELKPIKRKATELFRTMFRDVWNTARSRVGWSGMLFCISPVGTAAAMQLFTSFSDDYKASGNVVAIVNGYAGGVITGVSCIISGYFCDRINRRVAYLIAGAATAICAVAMAIAPMNQATYIVGALFYLLITGLCYAAFTAAVLEIIGNAGATASTQYVLFTAAGNFAIAYVVKLEGYGYTWWQSTYGQATAPRGVMFADAALNMAGVIVLLILMKTLGIGRGKASDASKAA
jgi:MFS transporter, PAT family, beta-lactamase induction signal transducer AmpG